MTLRPLPCCVSPKAIIGARPHDEELTMATFSIDLSAGPIHYEDTGAWHRRRSARIATGCATGRTCRCAASPGWSGTPSRRSEA